MGQLWDILQRHIDAAPYPPSERQVAMRLGVSPTTLANWRDPKKLPSRENLQAIADLAGVRYSVVLDAALHDTGYHEAGGEHAAVAPMTRARASRRPVAVVEAELGAAEAALADWDELEASGAVSAEVEEAKGKRAELQADVDRLKTELSRHANGESQSVAKS
jgi:transcriptional regulator with XRE-family HTH domain